MGEEGVERAVVWLLLDATPSSDPVRRAKRWQDADDAALGVLTGACSACREVRQPGSCITSNAQLHNHVARGACTAKLQRTLSRKRWPCSQQLHLHTVGSHMHVCLCQVVVDAVLLALPQMAVCLGLRTMCTAFRILSYIYDYRSRILCRR